MSTAPAPVAAFVRAVDWVSDQLGRLCTGLMIFAVVMAAYNALARDLGKTFGVRLAGNVLLELQWYVFSAVFLLGAGYTLKAGAHVRVDVLYERVSPKGQRLLDLFSLVVLALPFCGIAIVLSLPAVHNSWAILEASADAGGLPRYPVKTLVPLGFMFLALQVIAEIFKRLWPAVEGGESGDD